MQDPPDTMPAGWKEAVGQPPDPVKLLSPVIEIFLPVGFRDQQVTMIGLWFDTIGILHIYIQQAVVPDNVFTQVKVITIRLPVGLGFLVFNLALALFFTRTMIEAMRAAAFESAQQIQRMLEHVINKINEQNQSL